MFDQAMTWHEPPQTTLISGPAGCGKTEAALDAIVDARTFGSAFSPIWVLLPTGEQVHAFRRRLLKRSEDGVQFGVEFFNFNDLYGRLLDLFGNPQRQIGETARYQVLRAITTWLADNGALEVFGPIAGTSGFIGLVAGLIHELKQELILPEAFAAAAETRTPKDRDLARIYATYQQFLQERRLVDRHGAGWLAVEMVEHAAALPLTPDLLVVDGFDQFNRVHVRLLTALARHIPQTILTLTQAPGAHGRRFRRLEQTRARLLAVGPDIWRAEQLDSYNCPAQAARPPVLDHLLNTLFESSPARIAKDESLTLIEAPDIVREVQAVLRGVKRRLLAGTPPDEIAIVARQPGLYSAALRETARAYGIPLVVREGVSLRDNPAVAALLTLLDLAARDFPRRELLDVLRSPYFEPPGLTLDQIAQLERLSLTRQVVRGRAVWLDAVRAAAQDVPDEDGDSAPESSVADPAALLIALEAFFTRITPPAAGSVVELTAWIEGLIGPDPAAQAEDSAEATGDEAAPEPGEPSLNLLACIRAGQDADRVVRDLLAVGALQKILRGIRAAYDLVHAGGAAALAWGDFRAELELAIDRDASLPPGGQSRLGRVLATDVLEVRGLPHAHVFLLGLAEGIFPAPEPEEALYTAGERQALAAAGIELQTAAERSDDMSLFYQVIGLARESLTISRFYVDDKGRPCPPSPYWSAIRASVEMTTEEIMRGRLGTAPELAEAATLGEAAVAVAAIFSGEPGVSHLHDALGVYNDLLLRADWRMRWQNALRGRAIEAVRESTALPFDLYTGMLAQPGLVQSVADELGPDHTWSASQLNDYGTCPFKFFARRVLRLDPLNEPEEGLDARQRGNVNHAILQDTYQRIAARGLAIVPENQAEALAILEEVAAQVFASAPERFGFRAAALWEHEQDDLYRRLRRLVQIDFSPLNPFVQGKNPLAGVVAGRERRPWLLEASFGADGDPLVLDGPAGPIKVRGIIDRMDVCGDQVIVIDYKSGGTKLKVQEMEQGRNFQMMLYMRAAEALVKRRAPGLTVAGGLFWHLNDGKVSGEVLATDDALNQAQGWLHEHISRARQGSFIIRYHRTRSGAFCTTRCDFSKVCRARLPV